MLEPEIVDLSTPEFLANPYPVFRELRSLSPLACVRVRALPGRDGPLFSWALLRHADVSAALKAPETFSSQVTSVLTVVPCMPVLHDDPPRHTHVRRLASKAFTPKRVAELQPWIAALTRELLDALGTGPSELMSGLCVPLPVTVIAAMLGIPKQLHDRFRSWSEALIGYAAAIPPEERARRRRELAECFAQAIADRRREGARDDLLSAFMEAEVDGQKLSDQEIVALSTLMLIAGNETTTALLGNMLYILAERPDLWRRAREDRSLVEPIIEETLRYESPVQRLSRLTTRDVELSGVKIPAGQLVDIFYGAANRDPAVFDAPDEFRLGRPAAEHLGFGLGIHFCIGAPLARAEARIVLNQMLDRFEGLSPGSEPPVRQRAVTATYAYQRLPLVLDRA